MITTVDFTYCLISQGSQYLCHSIDTVPIGHVNSSFGHESHEKSFLKKSGHPVSYSFPGIAIDYCLSVECLCVGPQAYLKNPNVYN